MALSVAGTCPTLNPKTQVVLSVTAAPAGLQAQHALVHKRLRALTDRRVDLLPQRATTKGLLAEGGAQLREQVLLEARVRFEFADTRFKELDDTTALAAITTLSARLVGIHQTAGATELLARAHLLAAAIYLARGEIDAVQYRLHRALDLDPKITAPGHRFDPRLTAELAAASQNRGERATGRLEVRPIDGSKAATVYLDGHPVGAAPLVLDAVPAGRHLLRISGEGTRSALASVRIEAGETLIRSPNLRTDPERMQMQSLTQPMSQDDVPESTLALLARRAGADHALIAELVLSPRLGPTGEAQIGVRLRSSAGGTGWAPDPKAESLAIALSSALSCRIAPWPDRTGPALLGVPSAEAQASAFPAPKAWWRTPWVWAAVVGLVLGGASAMVAARASSGPPDALTVTLVPRP